MVHFNKILRKTDDATSAFKRFTLAANRQTKSVLMTNLSIICDSVAFHTMIIADLTYSK